jgi:hypothetical protein
MKDTETKLTCFKLRAEGRPLAAIADTVGVRRQTVANWLKDHEEEVENLKAIEIDALRETCWMTTQARIERLSTRLEQMTAELVELELKTRAELAREFAESPVRSEQQLRNAKNRRILSRPPELKPDGDTKLLLEAEESGNGRKRSHRAD